MHALKKECGRAMKKDFKKNKEEKYRRKKASYREIRKDNNKAR